jgi:ABC-2 type transport system ATP-binding protein
MNTLVAPIAGGAEILTQVLRALDDEGVTVEDIGLRRPTLDDVFLTITGRHAEEEAAQDAKPGEPGGER